MESLPVCSSGRHRKSILYGHQAEARARLFSICSVTSFLSLVPYKTWVLDWTEIGASGKGQRAGLRCSSEQENPSSDLTEPTGKPDAAAFSRTSELRAEGTEKGKSQEPRGQLF